MLRVLIGPTASGKERLALALAERLGAEIVSADSMKVYRGLDIGTAKPSPADRARTRHHCLDLAEPGERFTAAQFVAEARAAIRDIERRGHVALLSGGTPFYYMALLEGLFEGPGRDEDVRARLEARAARDGSAALWAALAAGDPASARKIHPNDARRLVRALEVLELAGEPISGLQRQWRGFHGPPAGGAAEGGAFPAWRGEVRMARLDWPRPLLLERVGQRIARMRQAGLLEEARGVWERRATMAETPLQAVAYKEFFPYFEGREPEDAAWERLRRGTARLAKAQVTWFKRFPAVAVPCGGPDWDEAGLVAVEAVMRAWDSLET